MQAEKTIVKVGPNRKLDPYVDEAISPEQSLLLRYHRVLPLLQLGLDVPKEDIVNSSIAEGARIFPLSQYQGVDILVCDESSLMATGTYKDLDACLISSLVSRQSLNSVVLSSGGNLGYAMARYARKVGIQVYFFHPKSTLYKLDANNFKWDGIKVITVDRPEQDVKQLAKDFAQTYGLVHVPNLSWRFAASAVRAMHIAELLFERQKIDWLAQTICAGFGPVGIYDCWSELSERDLIDSRFIPPFLGIQQETNAPIVRAWEAKSPQIKVEDSDHDNQDYIEPGLYNTNPGVNYANLLKVMSQYGGDFLAVSKDEYRNYEGMIVSWFRNAGLEFTRISATGEILEKTGVLTGAGILKAIDLKLIPKGSKVLYLLTGGFRKYTNFTPLKPDIEVDQSQPVPELVRIIGTMFGL
jgi:threonine synthase